MKAEAAPLQQRTHILSIIKPGWIAAFVTVVTWASAFPGIRVGLEGYSPYSLALLRYLIASAVLAIYIAIIRAPLPDWRDLPALTFLGFMGFSVYNVALNAGEVQISAGVASFLIASGPIYMALFAIIFFKERLTRWGWLGIAVSFGGVSLISLAGESGFSLNVYALLVLLAAASQGVYAVWMRRYIHKYGALRATTYAIWTGTVLMLVFTPGLLTDLRTAPAEATWAVIYMGVVPGAIGYVCWSFVLSRIPASVAGSLLYLIPLVATFIAWLWLAEIPGGAAFIGGALIIAGVIVVNRLGRQ